MAYTQNPTKRVSSRLARKEQKKLSRQTFGVVVLSVVILLFFIFVLLPGGVKLFFSFLDSNTGLEETDTLPPQVPILSSPVEATFSASVKLTGFAEPKSKVVVVANGEKDGEIDVADDGDFEYNLALTEGQNEFTLYSKDEAENESAMTKNYSILFDKDIPTIDIESPENGVQIEAKKNQNIEVKGKTEAGAKMYLNDRLVFVKGDGSFSSNYLLSEGENILTFLVVDKAGNTSKTELKVHFRY